MQTIPQKVHFVGIGGIGMSALAHHLVLCGHSVSGSDRQRNNQTEKLRSMGVEVDVPHGKNIHDAQLVVRTSAVGMDNAEVRCALSSGVPVILREQLLGAVFDGFEKRIAVCGTHGKTTVTAMIHHVLERCGVEHAAFIGGEYDKNNYFAGKKVVVAEACEYNRSFLNLHPTLCVCLNVEYDHPDCYVSQKDVEQAFLQLFEQSEQVILPCRQSYLSQKATLFGESGVSATNLTEQQGKFSFDVTVGNAVVGRCSLPVCGRHNVDNALATIAAAAQMGLPLLQVLNALNSFRGVDRRWSVRQGAFTVACDYAHHPTEIRAAIATAKSVCRGKIIAVFQPHTYTRTAAFFDGFADCFDGVEVVYLPIYSAREKPLPNVTSEALCQLAKSKGRDAKYFGDFTSAAGYIKQIADVEDLVLLIGAGDVNTLADLLV